MKHNRGVILTLSFAVMLGLSNIFADFTEPVLVDADCSGRHWGTLYTNEVQLSWNWDVANAVKATLNIEGMTGSISTNFTVATSNWIWTVSETQVPSVEDVYDLTLSFYDAGDVMLYAQTSQLALVTGSFGAITVDTAVDSTSWIRVNGDVVIPYDAAWLTDSTSNGLPQIVIAKTGGLVETNSLPDFCGYMGWKLQNSIWGYGTFDLSLTFDGSSEDWTAFLTRFVAGTVILVK